MVRDGIYYGLAFILAAALVGWFVPVLAVIPLLLAAFFLWFFRDPERVIPADPGAVVSCADGKITDISVIEADGKPRTRISIFLNVFSVHVNRSPVSGVITSLEYKKGQYLNAMDEASAELNEQSICTVRTGDGYDVVFKQIAGLLARRVVFTGKVGGHVARGERIGLIKFGSRCDVILPSEAEITVKIGEHVSGGSSILAKLPVHAVGAAARESGSVQ